MRGYNMGKKGIKKHDGVQIDIYGNPVHVLNVQGIYRMVKCGKCGETVKSSKAKLHLSYGTSLNICNKCLEEMDSQKRISNASVRDSPRMEYAIESYSSELIKA